MPGTVFLAPTSDGRLSAGRVLRRAFEGGAQAALIAVTPWIGNELPSLDLPMLRETLILNHHKWKNAPQRVWVWDMMPESFKILGQIELSAEDMAASSNAFTGWQNVPLQSLLQWRWDHDREALLRDEALEAANQAETNRQRAATRAEYLRTLTLDSLVDRAWFSAWETVDSNLPIREVRLLIANLVDQLRTAPKLTIRIAKRLLKQSVQAFNRLDAAQQFISTIEREDLCEAYEQIMCAAKFPQVVDQIDQWRDW